MSPEIIEGNKLIAEFMKVCVPERPNPPYHSSWSWLMPVVEKIENSLKWEYEVEIGNNLYAVGQNIYTCIIHDVGNATYLEFENKSKIEAVWLAVTSFIKWYQNQILNNTINHG